jgi:hypothetical protein
MTRWRVFQPKQAEAGRLPILGALAEHGIAEPSAPGPSLHYRWPASNKEDWVDVRYRAGGDTAGELEISVGLQPSSATQTAATAATPYRETSADQLPVLPDLLIREENPRDRWGKMLGLNHEVQLDDPDFDERIYIESEAKTEAVQRALANRELRQTLVTLLAWPGVSLTIGPNGQASATWSLRSSENVSVQSRDDLDRIAEHMLNLRSELPQFERFGKPRQGALSSSQVLVSMALCGLAPALFIAMANVYRTIGDALYLSSLLSGMALALLVFMPLGWLYARGRSKGLRLFVGLVLLTLWVVPFTAMAIGLGINGGFDSSYRIQKTKVLSVDKSYGKAHSMKLVPWRPHQKSISVTIDYSSYLSKPGHVELKLGRGYLGYEWLRSFRLFDSRKETNGNP